MIPDEAIEAGAAAQYEDNTGHEWGSKPEFMAIWRHHSFVVLSAAEPHMRKSLTPAGAGRAEQIILTTIQELDALPVLTIVLNAGPNPRAWQKHHDPIKGRDLWYSTTDADWSWESYYILEGGNGVKVLWEPSI